MTTDNKTLADVQPGGRVRLGDALMPCPLCGNDAEFVPYKNNGLTLKCKSMGCIQRHQRTLRYGIEWLRTSMTEHWNTRALSAQPSRGGQGGLNYERMFVDACAALAEVSRELGCDPEQGGAEPILAAIADLREALAARQPVGEVIEYQIRGYVGGHWEKCDKEHYDNGKAFEAKYGAGQMSLYRTLVVGDAAPPAQAVDLGWMANAGPDKRVDVDSYKEAIQAARSNIGARRPDDEWPEDQWYWDKLTSLLALIDSQAVGNG